MSTTLIKEGPGDPGERANGASSPSTGGSGSTTARTTRIGIIAASICLLFSAVFRDVTGLDQEHVPYGPRLSGQSKIVGGDWLAGMLLGFREMVADLMWIQVDSYFHEGRYDKILPVCYVITAMDPGWVDVYITGGWHLGYNFGDRRLVPAAIDFDEMGVRNNPKNYDMWYELGWMEMTRGYHFAAAAKDFEKAVKLGLLPYGKRHAWPHALEAAGDLDGAIAAWKEIGKTELGSAVVKKQIFLLNLRREARKDLYRHPVDVHLSIKITRKGPRVLHIEGIANLPLLSKVFFDLRDSDWMTREKQSLSWRIKHYTLYSQTDNTLQPQWGLFVGQGIDFYQGTLRIHQGDKQYEQYPSEPLLPVVNGHMVVGNGYFKGDIDMAKVADQYPLESNSYVLTFFVNPRMEPISTQDVIGWDGSGMSGKEVRRIGGMNQLIWTHILTKKDIEG